MDSGKIVQVTTQIPALSEPTFVIEHEGRLYVTLALIEYDPKASGISDEQKRGVKEMQRLFKDAQGRSELKATSLAAGWRVGPGPVNTGPVNTSPGPSRGGGGKPPRPKG